MNGARRPQRSRGFPGRRQGAQFYARGRKARCFAIGAQPHHPPAGGPHGHSAADPQHAGACRRPRPASVLSSRSARASRRSRPSSTPCRELRDKPAGTIRITAGEHAVRTILWPRLEAFLREFPDIKVEVYIENRLTDIVAERYDAGVRLGEHVAKDMIAVRIGADWRLIVVGSPSYLRRARDRRRRRTISPHTDASTCGSRPMADSMPGSSRRADSRSTSASTGNSSSTAPCRS